MAFWKAERAESVVREALHENKMHQLVISTWRLSSVYTVPNHTHRLVNDHIYQRIAVHHARK